MRNNGQPVGMGTPGSDAGLSADTRLSTADAMMVMTIACMTMTAGCSDGGLAQMTDAGPTAGLDGSGPAIGKDAAPMTLTDGAVGQQDANKDSQMPNDNSNIAIPDPMSVMRRLKAVPAHVVFLDSNASVFVSGKNATINAKCYLETIAPIWQLTRTKSYELSVRYNLLTKFNPISPMAMMTDGEMQKAGYQKILIPKPGLNKGEPFYTMSIEDWIKANINDLDNAIANTVAEPGACD